MVISGHLSEPSIIAQDINVGLSFAKIPQTHRRPLKATHKMSHCHHN